MKKDSAWSSDNSEGGYRGPPSQRVRQGLAQAAQAERAEARRRQAALGIVPVKTNFKIDNDDALKTAMQSIWDAGPHSKLLYCRISKGLSCLSREDVIRLGVEDGAIIEALAPGLARGYGIWFNDEPPKRKRR